jgi:hypothetical protein
MAVIARIHEFGAQEETVSLLHQSTHEHSLDFEFPALGLRVNFTALVVENRTSRHHLEIGKLRQTVDEAVSNAITEELCILIVAVGGDWQNCHGINRAVFACVLIRIKNRRADHQGNKYTANGPDDGSLAAPPRLFRQIGTTDRGSFPCFSVSLQPLQVGANIGGVLVTKAAVFFQTLRDDPFQFDWQVRVYSNWRYRCSIQDRIKHRACRVPSKRKPARTHFVEHRAEREQVGASLEFLPANLLGRHISDGSQRTAGTRQMFH